MSDYLTASDAADFLGKSERFVKDEIRRKNLRAFKIGGEWKLELADLKVYVEAHANVRPVGRRSA